MLPQRISSEGPEVVPGQPGLYVADAPSHLDRFRRKKGSLFEKQVAAHQSPALDNQLSPATFESRGDEGGYETPASMSSPRATERLYQSPGPSYDLSSYDGRFAGEQRYAGRKVCGLMTTIILVVIAFLVGAGVGGGIGGAIAVKNKESSRSGNSTNLAAVPTSTSSACGPTKTIAFDTAGCPAVNNTTYNSTILPYTFLKVCATDITAPAGQFIDVANKVESSFDSCLDYCAQYTLNSTTKGQCVAATWVILSATDPTRNSRCYLKNATGVAIPQISSGQQAVSGYLKSA